IVTTPRAGAVSQLVSRNYDTGPDGAANSDRVIANIISGNNSPEVDFVDSRSPVPSAERRLADLRSIRPARVRKLYFSEDREDLRSPGKPPKYFITVEGKTPAV